MLLRSLSDRVIMPFRSWEHLCGHTRGEFVQTSIFLSFMSDMSKIQRMGWNVTHERYGFWFWCQIRDAEWLVRGIDKISTGGKSLFCVVLSEVVKDKEMISCTKTKDTTSYVDIMSCCIMTMSSLCVHTECSQRSRD